MAVAVVGGWYLVGGVGHALQRGQQREDEGQLQRKGARSLPTIQPYKQGGSSEARPPQEDRLEGGGGAWLVGGTWEKVMASEVRLRTAGEPLGDDG